MKRAFREFSTLAGIALLAASCNSAISGDSQAQTASGGKPLDLGRREAIAREALIDDLDRGIGIADGLVHGGGVYRSIGGFTNRPPRGFT